MSDPANGKEHRVFHSVHNESLDRCVDFFVRLDGSFGYKEFRRDPEDQGSWYLTAFDERGVFESFETALKAAERHVRWLLDAPVTSKQWAP